MTSGWQMRAVLLVTLLVALVALTVLPSPSAAALGAKPPPTPTSEGGGGGKDRKTTPVPPKATISGYVYDYSIAARKGEAKVVLDGGGWRLETVTDSNGYYRFGDLGVGTAVLRLYLPPEATPVTPEWVLNLESGGSYTVNLGYYWGHNPPIPVILSGTLSGNTLRLQVENRTDEAATGAVIDIQLPPQYEPLTRAYASQGKADYQPGHIRVVVADVPAGRKATITVSLTKKPTAAAQAADVSQDFTLLRQISDKLQVVFVYDQQLTPQRLLFDATSISLASSPTTTATAAAAAGPTRRAALTPAAVPSPTARASMTEKAGGFMEAQEVEGEVAGQPTARPTVPKPGETPMPTRGVSAAATEGALPITGQSREVNVVAVVLPVLLVFGLAAAGWRALRASGRPK
jgi:hypothetical protein